MENHYHLHIMHFKTWFVLTLNIINSIESQNEMGTNNSLWFYTATLVFLNTLLDKSRLKYN